MALVYHEHKENCAPSHHETVRSHSVGVAGFEPAVSCTLSRRIAKFSYTPESAYQDTWLFSCSVPLVGFEPTILAALNFESSMYTSSITGA